MSDDSPVIESLWQYCLFQEMARARKEGRLKVHFDAVDQRVIELSKRITEWELPGEEREGMGDD